MFGLFFLSPSKTLFERKGYSYLPNYSFFKQVPRRFNPPGHSEIVYRGSLTAKGRSRLQSGSDDSSKTRILRDIEVNPENFSEIFKNSVADFKAGQVPRQHNILCTLGACRKNGNRSDGLKNHIKNSESHIGALGNSADISEIGRRNVHRHLRERFRCGNIHNTKVNIVEIPGQRQLMDMLNVIHPQKQFRKANQRPATNSGTAQILTHLSPFGIDISGSGSKADDDGTVKTGQVEPAEADAFKFRNPLTGERIERLRNRE